MRRMMIAGACLLALPLASCATTSTSYPKARTSVDLCKGATVRRQVYVTAIAVADGYAATGRPVPMAVTIGRDAALTALSVLDTNCPPSPVSAR